MSNTELARYFVSLYFKVYARRVAVSYNAQEERFYVTIGRTTTYTRVGMEAMVRQLEAEA